MPARNPMINVILEAVKTGSQTAPETAFRVFSDQQRAGLKGHVLSQGKRSLRRNSLTDINVKKVKN